jgi:hypothetical protein
MQARKQAANATGTKLTKLTIKEKLRLAKQKVYECEQAYETQIYLETMPLIDPAYKYCYSISNRTIPYETQSVDAWLRAVMVHMANRRSGHGGAVSKSEIVFVPDGFVNQQAIENYLEYIQTTLRKRFKIKKKIITK